VFILLVEGRRVDLAGLTDDVVDCLLVWFEAVENLAFDFQLGFRNRRFNRLRPNLIVPVHVGGLGSFSEDSNRGTGVTGGVFSDMFEPLFVDDAVRKPSAGAGLEDSDEFLIGVAGEVDAVTVPQPAL